MRKSLPIIIILGCFAIFAFGIIQLFELRFEAGDVYPPYSSLRSDPLGTMALYESVEKLPGISVERDFSANNKLPETPYTSYLHLAAEPYEWKWMDEDEFLEVDTFVKRGGRLVITLFPESSTFPGLFDRDETETNAVPAQKKNTKDAKNIKDNKDTKDPGDSKGKKSKKPLDDQDSDFKTVSLEDRWGMGFSVNPLMRDANDVYIPVKVKNRSDFPLPATLDWHSGLVLTNLDKAWQTIYTRGTNAVVVERKFGHGTVVIATDSYFLSNEAMLKDRHADFLAWLVGPAKTVVFDEAHLGVVQTSGVAGLMRKYRLYWLVGGLILLAALFIWKNSLSLVPPHEHERREEYLAGKEAASGFVNLLRRNISTRKLLETCFAEWKKSAAQSGKYSAARVQQAEAIFQAENARATMDQTPLAAYQNISAVLNTKHGTRKT